MSFNDTFGNFDADEARYNRQNRINQPEVPPTQTDDSIFNPSPINSQLGGDNAGGNGDIFNSGVGGNGSFGAFGGSPQQGQDIFGAGGQLQPQQQQGDDIEDKFYKAVGVGAKGTANFFKDFGKSFQGLPLSYWQKYGKNVMWVGIACFFVGIVGKFVGWQSGLQCAVGGCLAGAIGVFTFMMMTEKIKNGDDEGEIGFDGEDQIQDTMNAMPDDMGWDATPDQGWGSSDDFGDTSGDDDFGDDFGDDYEDDYGDNEDDDWDFSSTVSQGASEGMSADEAFNSTQEVPIGMYTRQYLYDNFCKVLPTITPGFSHMQEIDEDSDDFLYWGDKLREAAQVAGCKEDYLPELQRLQKNLFTIILTCDRPQGFKAEQVSEELANIYAYKDDGTLDDKVYATYVNVGLSCIITIFNGNTEMITVKDTYSEVKDFILDSKNYLPVVLGVDQLGKVICCDFKKVESCIIAGMPRSGKSWTVQSVITQMCAFVSPSELIFYIIDPKADTSDFRSFKLPHVKRFACRYTQETGGVVNPDKEEILATLDYIVNKEAPRRKKMIGSADCVNIWDYRKKYPDVKLPLLYVIIDEAVTLAEDMGKDEKRIYQGYVTQIITQFPNLGIRAFLIPHVVKNDIIKKTATDSMKCRISVNGSPDHIESSTGTKPKDFKFKLSHVGDMAVYMPEVQRQTMFVHSAILSDSNEKNNDIFDYLRRVWGKLEPDEIADSVAAKADVEKENKELLDDFSKKFNDDELIDMF